MKLKIVFIIGQLSIGGYEKYLINLATGLNKKKFDIEVVCLSDKLDLKQNLIDHGCKIHVINPNFLRKPLTILRLRKLINSINPQVIHSIGRSWYYGIPASIGINTKVVISSQSIPPWKGWTYKLLDKLLFKNVSLCFANAKMVKEKTWNNTGMPPDKCKIIYTGLNIDRFDADQQKDILNAPSSIITQIKSNPTLVVVARLEPIKSVHTIIKAQKTILKFYPNAQLWIVGTGSLEKELKKLTSTLNLTKNVHFWGNRSDVPAILAKSDIGMFSSLSEGLPATITEYMAARLPVISTNVGGISEQIINNVTGVFIPNNHPEDIVKAVCSILSDNKKMKEMGLAGRQVIEQRFSESKMISEHERTYFSLI